MTNTKKQQTGCMSGCCGEEHFGALVGQTFRVIRRAMDARIAAEVTPELTGVRGMLLGEIVRANKENRDVYQRDVEHWMQIRRSSVTAVLQAMEQDGFITRCSVERDARLKRLNATAKGVAYHERIRLSIDNFERELQRGVEPERQAVARAVLEQILANAHSLAGETRPASESTAAENG
ncbi:MarR family winged helix-turn-helix transcriptional regulator [Subdoligranulum variabile]|nr:winged helix DNA-binding protein [Subdoligranulum variabile]UWP67791.1 winged helix DNA-binding protein [Subdoligranulum variabile]